MARHNRRWWALVVLLIILILPLAGILFFSKDSTLSIIPDSIRRVIRKPIEYKNVQTVFGSNLIIRSNIHGYELVQESIDYAQIKEFLEQLKIFPLENLLFIDRDQLAANNLTTTITPATVEVILEQIKDLSLSQAKTIYNEGDVVYTTGVIEDNAKKVTIHTYVDIKKTETYPVSLDRRLTFAVIGSLFFSFQSPPLERIGDPTDAALEKIGRSFPAAMHFKKASGIPFLNSIKQLLIPPVYAWIPVCDAEEVTCCFGSVDCGNLAPGEGTCAAPYGSTTCSFDWQCPNLDCNVPMICVDNGENRTCLNDPVNGCMYPACSGCNFQNNCTLECGPSCGCSCTAWTYGSCGVLGGCPVGQRRRTRSCNPDLCQVETECVVDATCGSTPTSTPFGATATSTPTPTTSGTTCSPGEWGFPACGGLGCGACFSPQCNASGNAWNCVWNPGLCCPAATSTPTPTTSGPTNTPTSTPVAGQCPAAVVVNPPASACSNPPANGSVIWRWEPVAGADEYELVVLDDVGTIIVNLSWQDSFVYNCEAGLCRYSTSLPNGTYRARIRARGTCTASNFSYTEYAVVSTCPTPTPSPTPPAGQCSAPSFNEPPSVSCATCATCNGQVGFEWNTVAGATEYELVIRDGLNNVIQNLGWNPAAFYSCAGGACSYTFSYPIGSYRAQIRARGTCTESTAGTSSLATISVCSGDIEARTKRISTSDTSCAAIDLSTEYAVPADMSLNPAVPPGAQTQTDGNYVTWTNVPAGTYTISVSAPSGYVVQNACWRRTITAPLTGTGLTASMATGETLTWYGIGYSLGTPWVQTQGGDVFVSSDVQALMADTVTPREFNATLDGFHGTVYYGGSYDFDPDVGQNGAGYVSQNGWLVNESGYHMYTQNCYQKYLERLDLTTATPDFTNPVAPMAELASRATPYLVQGDLITTGSWNITNGENVIVLVNGNLTIGNGAGHEIRRSGTGFVSFIVNGNITVNSGVGSTFSSTTPDVEGFYCTTGTFSSGASSVANRERLVGRGTFIANSFLLQRDLESVSQNQNYAGELFIYDPQLPFVMPDTMKDLRVRWTEIAP